MLIKKYESSALLSRFKISKFLFTIEIYPTTFSSEAIWNSFELDLDNLSQALLTSDLICLFPSLVTS